MINNLGLYDIVIDFDKMFTHNATNIYFSENDINTAKIRAKLVKKNEVIDLTGTTISIRLETITETIDDTATIVDATNGIIEYTFPTNTLIEGVNFFVLFLTEGDSTKASPKLAYKVLDSIEGAGAVEGANEYPVLIQLISDTNKAINKANEAYNKATAMQSDLREVITNANNTIDATNIARDKANEATANAENKIVDVENRFRKLTVSQQQDAEVIDARDGEVSLKDRLERDLAKGKIHFESIEGNHISIDSQDSYIQNLEIKGNTIQDPNNLSDIRSVGDMVEGQELYKIPLLSVKGDGNLFDGMFANGSLGAVGEFVDTTVKKYTPRYYPIEPNEYYYNNVDVICFYDKDKNFISRIIDSGGFTTPQNCKYFRFRTHDNTSPKYDLSNYYVSKIKDNKKYESNKLTILSPTQLEKVGDVADRIIEKDGVWGVEKNNITILFNGDEPWGYNASTKEFYLSASNGNYNHLVGGICISDRFSYDSAVKGEGKNNCIVTGANIFITLRKDEFTDLNSFKSWINSNNFLVKYPTTQPTFIPLPHAQQVKLRTFANKTNISFLCEIEGTVKGEVPKSLGATVNTHTTQIDNLNKELDRVKKLEESTVSTVVTDKDFTVVEETSNGYFEDVKLEGKTLVVNSQNEEVEPGTEGAILKSVGDETDKIVVSSFGTNNLGLKGIYSNNGNIYGVVEPKPNKGFVLNKSNKIIILSLKNSSTWTRNIELNPLDSLYLENNLSAEEVLDEVVFKGSYGWGDVAINEIKEYIHFNSEPKADKKQLLYYDPQDSTWKKPVLREWDTVEKHADGKYYYHRRSGEVVLKGNEEIYLDKTHTDNLCFRFAELKTWSNNSRLISDKFKNEHNVYDTDKEGIYYTGVLRANILKSKLETQDVAGFKKWLQANNVTVVYQLAQEEVYECTNIDLITYTGQTNFMIESGVLCPKTTLKVHNNISNVVNLLQKKVSLLENKFIEGLKSVLAGDMQSLAYILYPEDFKNENDYIMTLPIEPM